MIRTIETTDDGSATLYVPELDEHYHSVKGARTESQHIFIDMGLKASPAPVPRVLEVGFGTGLNAQLTLEEAERSGRHVHYTGIERYPLTWKEISPLHYTDHPLFEALHRAPWGQDVPVSPHFTLRKIEADVHQALGNFFILHSSFFILRRGVFRCLRPRKAARNVERKPLPGPVATHVPRCRAHHLLRQRCGAAHAPVHRIPRGTLARPSRRKA